ncbi:hypothetical protein [Streptacidiphilus fuscans]|uniref:DUF4034 domain-containing protein n=1 Tax=Streptacidiphilus fuscans TaxID=2789292 RepID=A0A931FB66_9ACTN|nr:hypothetical protein [Streptacidiphilus fuscans]MBF9067128.1 hypothetical protein [Streptacidiphilus fuscans]
MSNLSFVGPALVVAGLVARTVAQGKRSQARVRSSGPRPVSVHHDYDDPELAELLKAAGRADWDATAAVLRPCRDRGDHNRLIWLIGCIEDHGGEFLVRVGERRADDALARTVCGARHVAWAWEARTRAQASHVSREQFELFHERLRMAEEHLYAAVELDPESAAPWCSLTVASRGLQHGSDVTRRRFEAGVRRAPTDLGLHAAMLQQVCAKWGGSHEEMHAFARESLVKSPPGSGIGALTAFAHIEHWLDLPQVERGAYIRTPDVVEELRRAAAVSVLHADYAPTESPFPALNAFAMAFWLAGDLNSARPLFERIGDHPTRYPWGFYGNAGQAFANARQECTKGKPSKPVPRAEKPKRSKQPK